MATIGIDIEARTKQATTNIGQLQSSFNKLAREFVTARAEGESLDKTNAIWEDMMNIMLNVEKAARNVGDATAAVTTKMQMFDKALASVGRAGFGLDDAGVKELKDYADLYAVVISKRAEDEEAIRRQQEETAKLKAIEEDRINLLNEWISAKEIHQAELNKEESEKEEQANIEYQEQIRKKLEEQAKALKSQEDAWKNVGSAIKQNDSILSQWINRFKTITTQILIFRTVMNITNKIVNGFKETLKDSVKQAAEAEQVYSKLNTVFGEFSNAQNEAITLASKLGVSSKTAASSLSTVGDLLQAQGAGTVESLKTATDWVEQFQDIIAFKDIDMSLEEFAQNFMSGAAGNLRNFRTFGSIVKESAVNARLAAKGLDTLTGSELELAKMTARAEIALEQQKNAMGATEREMDTMLSLQRRYNEASNEIKETIGNWISPVTKGWLALKTEILETINEYNRAKGLTQEENFGPIEAFSIRDENGNFTDKAEELFGLLFLTDNNPLAMTQQTLRNLVRVYDVTMSDIDQIFNYYTDKLKDDGISILSSTIPMSGIELDSSPQNSPLGRMMDNMRSATNDVKTEKSLKVLEERFVESAEGMDRFLESLQELDRVNFVESDWYKAISEALTNPKGIFSEEGAKEWFSNVPEIIQDAINETLEDIDAIGSSPTEILFGEDDEAVVLKNKIKEYRDLYTKLESAQAIGLGVTSTQLELVKGKWDLATEALENYNDELKRQEELSDVIKSFGTSGGNYATMLAEAKISDGLKSQGLSEERANARATLLNYYNNNYQEAIDQGRYNEFYNAYKSSLDAMNEWFNRVEKLAEEEAEKTRKQGVDDRLASYQGTVDDLKFSTFTMGMSELDAQLWEASRGFVKLVNDLDMTDEEYNEAHAIYEAYTKALEKNYETQKQLADDESIAEMWKNVGEQFTSMFGTGGAVFSAIKDMRSGDAVTAAGGKTSLLGILMDILSKTEAFQKIATIVDDTIVPILDLVLKPLLPIVENIVKSIQDAIGFLMPVFKAIVAALGSIDVVISMIHATVHNILEWVKKAVNWNYKVNTISVKDAIKEAMARTDEALANIEGWTHSTAKNTEKADYSTYADLLSRGMLSYSDYTDLVKSKMYSSSTPMGSATMTASGYGNARYVTLNGLTVVTSIKSAEELEEWMSNLDGRRYGENVA